MAARVVWLCRQPLRRARGGPGLTFTCKAASELGARIRRRLAAPCGCASARAMGSRRVAAYATGRRRPRDQHLPRLCVGRFDRRLRTVLPVEPSSTLLSETELWQLAFSVVANHPGDPQTRKVPTGVTETVLKLYPTPPNTLSDSTTSPMPPRSSTTSSTRSRKGRAERATVSQDAGISGRHRRAAGAVAIGRRTGRTDARTERPDFGSQMSLAARLVVGHPEVVAAERRRCAVLLDEYQDTGHSQRVLLRALFGGEHPSPSPRSAIRSTDLRLARCVGGPTCHASPPTSPT